MCKIFFCIVVEGKWCVNGFVSLRIIVSILFALASMEGSMGRPMSEFHFSPCWPQSQNRDAKLMIMMMSG